MEREKIYESIDTERDYQDSKWGTEYQYTHPQAIIDIELILNQAKEDSYHLKYDEVMHKLRKIAAVCVVCGEVNGMPERDS